MSRKWLATKTLALAILTIAVLALPPAGPAAAAAAKPTNGIITPADGATVKGPVEVTGYAMDPAFDKWQLDVLPGGDAAKAGTLAVGTSAGSFNYVMDSSAFPVGAHVLRLRLVHPDGNYEEFLHDFTVSASVFPTNGILSPAAGTTVSGKVTGLGYANDATFDRWQLELLPGGDAAASPIAVATSKAPGYFKFSLDTTALPAGAHALRLRVVRLDGNYADFLTDFTVTGTKSAAGSTLEALRGNPGGGL
jgi:hypothetical protein